MKGRRSTSRKQHHRSDFGTKKSVKGVPKTPEDLYSMSKAAQEDWGSVLEGVLQVRGSRLTVPQAARFVGLPYRKFLKLAGAALEKGANGRYRAKRIDRLLRVMNIPQDNGIHEIAAQDSREASKLGEYWETVHHFIATGDGRRLSIFRDKFITDVYGVRHPLLTDTDELSGLANVLE